MKTLVSTFTAVLIFLTSNASALSERQKKELLKFGTITVYEKDVNGKIIRNESGKKIKKGHFEVKFMPGVDNIMSDAQQRWLEATELMKDFLDEEDFWRRKFIGSFNDGIEHIRDSLDAGVSSIPEKFRKTLEENAELNGDFGSFAAKLKNWGLFTSSAGAALFHSVWGLGVGSVYAVVTPTGHLLYRPIAAGTKALVRGTIWPVLRYSWNGAAWIAVREGDEPKVGDMTVTFVPESLDHTDTALSSEDEEETTVYDSDEL